MSIAQSSFFQFVNRPFGRILRFGGGAGLVLLGYSLGEASSAVGPIVSMLFGVLMAATSALHLCPASAVFGGPIRGKHIVRG